MKPLRTILVIGMNYIGDTLFTTPLLRALHKAYPESAIDALNGASGAPILQNNPYVRTVIEKPSRTASKAERNALITTLRENRYDAAFIATTSFESALTAFRARIPVRAGLRHEGRSFLLTHSAKRSIRENIIYQILSVLPPLGIPDDGPGTELFLADAEEQEAKRILKQARIEKKRPLVVHTGATRVSKRWNWANFAKLITAFHSETKVPVILAGGKDDVMTNALIAADAGNAIALNLTDALSLRHLAGVIKYSWAYVGCDSAGLHIASAMNTHTIGLFGGTDPAMYGPLNDGDAIISRREEFPPFVLRRADKRTKAAHPAMEAITVSETLERLKGLYAYL